MDVARTSSLRRTDGWHSTNVGDEARVEVPNYVTGDFEVFVNGVPQVEGRDYEREGRQLVFNRSLAKEGRLGAMRWLSLHWDTRMHSCQRAPRGRARAIARLPSWNPP